MASTDTGLAGFSSVTNRHRRTRALWLAAIVVAACYGIFLIVTALRLRAGAELTGQFWLDHRIPKKAEVATHLVNLAWNGLSGLERRPAMISVAKGCVIRPSARMPISGRKPCRVARAARFGT